MEYSIGIDLGGSSVKAVAINNEGKSLTQKNQPFDSEAAMDWAEKVRRLYWEMQSELGHPPDTVGISAPGLAAADGRSIACMPGRLQGLEGLEWTKHLNSTKPVPVLNDAHAALVGEAWIGAARGFKHAILLTLGTGVGGAFMTERVLVRGRCGRAGHFGHATVDFNGPPDITQMPGSLEVAIGNCTLAQRSGGRFTSTKDLVAAHLNGDAEATNVWLRSVRALACAIGSFINIVDPEAVIIGGG
ncbi:MAG: ROK family protein, partial [Verrucomicrobia bacterium]|nr:ROK family protein [Verrucomicrobiota bacterium]